MLKILLAISLLTIASSGKYAYADIQVDFIEGAPKDKFVFHNTGRCDLESLALTLDLSESRGGLIFDTTATGKGVEVFQPFEVAKGDLVLDGSNKVEDGDRKLSIVIKEISVKDSASFTIDVDDTLDNSALGNIRVTDNEISNATISANLQGHKLTKSIFNAQGQAIILTPEC